MSHPTKRGPDRVPTGSANDDARKVRVSQPWRHQRRYRRFSPVTVTTKEA